MEMGQEMETNAGARPALFTPMVNCLLLDWIEMRLRRFVPRVGWLSICGTGGDKRKKLDRT
jgi:hypothetical protein